MDDDSTKNTPDSGPQSDRDWTVHSLNIHGTFFERWCQHIVRASPPWSLTTTNFPVEVQGHHSALDIRADHDSSMAKLILLIECKKNNPEFVDWIFFPRHGDSLGTLFRLCHLSQSPNPPGNGRVEYDLASATLPFVIADIVHRSQV